MIPPNNTSGKIIFFLLILGIGPSLFAQESYIYTSQKGDYFPLVSPDKSAAIYIDQGDFKGVHRAAEDLQKDIERVTGKFPELYRTAEVSTGTPVIIGTLGKSSLIDQLVQNNKIKVSEIEGKWETFAIQVVQDPLPGVEQALVIVGSDKRGTIFGVYDVSKEIGVSPWYYWADVPAKKSDVLYVQPGTHTKGTPKVKYRGIFINDEAPALAGWATENFGGFTSGFYEHVFELILRMQGNYLWPAMWGRAFYDDDPQNPVLADEYGMVIGTSHHEPLMRAHDEWRRFGEGEWNYNTNPEKLQQFWRGGIARMGDYESVVTVGMRGDGDEPMTEGTAIELLERIVADQREIISEVTGKPAAETPQVWALYKEVQDYYDQGMRVPDDVTLLLADDNWGNIRKLPNPEDKPREGGYGIYYHYDYVGGPRNYKWINTNQISRVWEQMNLAYEFGADELWIVNVGDIKPMEYPTSFFLDYAWDPTKIGARDLRGYTEDWAARQLPEEYSEEIADILLTYSKYNSRRKPELLSPETYSLTHFNEAERVVKEYRDLENRAEAIYKKIPEEYKDAYFQIVLFPVKASANLNELYVSAAKNNLYAEQGRAVANKYAVKTKELFDKDAELTDQYHTELADGKWNHMMSQTHIGYTYWQQPDQNNMPEVHRIDIPEKAQMGVVAQGSKNVKIDDASVTSLPVFDPFNDQEYYVEIFNKGQKPFQYKIQKKSSWIEVSEEKGIVEDQKRLLVSVNWEKAPKGQSQGSFRIKGTGAGITVEVPINNPVKEDIKGFVESNGYISIEAANFTKNYQKNGSGWQLVPNLGRTGSAMTSFPDEPVQQEISKESPHLSYKFHNLSRGEAEVVFYLSPTLDFRNQGGLKFAFSIDDREPQVINMHEQTKDNWNTSVANNVTKVKTKINLEPGNHTLKVWAMESGIVLQKILIKTGEEKETYLGPPESAKVE
ncbi:glycosyl hydrolase 115 family protein [Salinimicrobium xinjiangense]|uniref:glycosyl hydrolase 115 family protein n=1 Tax=Salinimicrobium xinjiangense TaxID=438596 RepID=UPI000429E53A|nr:glycosyl hydrolase 115 family protein [Salinimicrobium xinjiangense]